MHRCAVPLLVMLATGCVLQRGAVGAPTDAGARDETSLDARPAALDARMPVDTGTDAPSTDAWQAPPDAGPACRFGELAEIVPGVPTTFTTCGLGDEHTYLRGEGCDSETRANGEDTIFALRLDARAQVDISLRDVASPAIDTIVYLRRACDDAASQLACDDDVPCSESTVSAPCNGGTQRRESHLTVHLDPGTYYVVVDHFVYTDMTTWVCGDVELTVTLSADDDDH